MIQIKNKIDCCGCNACGDVCAHGAITFKTDKEGFWYPEVDASKCKDCGLCEKVCPVINIGELKKNDLPQSVCYAAEHKNLEVVFDSTSGGLFSALADRMYRDSGYVGGAIFNEDFSVREYISNDKKDLSIIQLLKRSIIINSLATGIIGIIITMTLNKNSYINYSRYVQLIETTLILLSVGFALYREDGRGLHDLFGGTRVISSDDKEFFLKHDEIKEAEVVEEKPVNKSEIKPKRTTKKKDKKI